MNTRCLYILVGKPGSGKSTFAEVNLANQVAGHWEADMFFEDPETGKYIWNRNKINLAHKWCQKQVRHTLETQGNCVVANTNLTVRDLKPYFEMVKDLNFKQNEINYEIFVVEFRFEYNFDDCTNYESNSMKLSLNSSVLNSVHFQDKSIEELCELCDFFDKKELDNRDSRFAYYKENSDIIRDIVIHTLKLKIVDENSQIFDETFEHLIGPKIS